MSDSTPVLTREDHDRIRPKLIARFRRQGVRDHELEGLIQKTFLTALGSLHRFEGRAELDTWVVSIGKNVWLHHVRGQRAAKRDGEAVELDEQRLEPPASANPEAEAADREELERVVAAIKSLPEKLSQPLLMKARGNPVKKIAAVLGITPELVTSRIHQAREKLRRLFPERQRSPSR